MVVLACWSVKGGCGTTVVAAGVGSILASRGDPGALVVDLAGDLPAALGFEEPASGLTDWLAAGDLVPADALSRLEVVSGSLSLLPRGPGPLIDVARAQVLAAVLAAEQRPVVVDCGRIVDRSDPVAAVLAGAADESLLVVRPCYLAVRRAVVAPVAASGVVVVEEPERSLDAHDVERSLGLPVRAQVPLDASIARAVDSGTLGTRVPRVLARALRDLA